MSVEKKARMSDVVIYNDEGPKELTKAFAYEMLPQMLNLIGVKTNWGDDKKDE